jgi:hypothetical protein
MMGTVDAKYLMISKAPQEFSSNITSLQIRSKLRMNSAAIQVCWTVANVPSNFACQRLTPVPGLFRVFLGTKTSLHSDIEVIAAG